MNEWKMIARAVRSRWWVILFVAALVTAVAAMVSWQRADRFEATARVGVQVLNNAEETTSAYALYEGSLAAESKVTTYAELVSSDRLLEIAAEESDLNADDFRDDVISELVDNTVLFDVTATADSLEDARAKADAVANAYPDFVAEMETVEAGSSPLVYAVVMDDADGPTTPIAPTNVHIVVLGLLGGLVLGLGVALLVEFLDKRIRRIEDLDEVAGEVPVVGELPTGSGSGSAALVNFHSGYSSTAESIRAVRTQVRFLGAGAQVYLITSAVPGEGKSFISSNLARAFVEAGERVLLINADMRAPTTEKYFRLSNVVGLSNVLAGQVDVTDVVVEGGSRNPDVLPAGPIPPNPSELLGHDRMRELLAEARTHYDVILIDTPPVTAVTDPLVLIPEVDAVLMIARMRTVTSTELMRSLDLLKDAGATTCGILANGTPRKSSVGSGYGYAYVRPPEMPTHHITQDSGEFSAVEIPVGRSSR